MFPAYSLGQLSLVANIGLILFLFCMGLELDLGKMRRQMTLAAPIALSAIAVPFSIGALSSLWLYDVNDLPDAERTAFVLFFGTPLLPSGCGCEHTARCDGHRETESLLTPLH